MNNEPVDSDSDNSRCETCYSLRNNGDLNGLNTRPLPKGLVYGIFDYEISHYYVVINGKRFRSNDSRHISSNSILVLEESNNKLEYLDFLKNQCSINERHLLNSDYIGANSTCNRSRLLERDELSKFINFARRFQFPQVSELFINRKLKRTLNY